NSKRYEEATVFPLSLLDSVRGDIDEGRWASYQSPIAVEFTGEQAMKDALIVQAPFKLNPLPQSFAFLFVEEKKTLISDLYSPYLYLFMALFGVLFFVLLLMWKFFENTYKNKLLFEKNANEIKLLFKQQTMLLQQSNGFVNYHNKYANISKVSEYVDDVLRPTAEQFVKKVKQLKTQEDLVKIKAVAMESLEN